jgi:hypothetical protein
MQALIAAIRDDPRLEPVATGLDERRLLLGEPEEAPEEAGPQGSR